jgi:aldose 1-epimerase
MKKTFIPVILVLFVNLLTNCTGNKLQTIKPSAMKESFGTVEGRPVYLFTLENRNGMVVKITNYGAIITQIIVPDRNGKMGDVVLGYDSLEGYIANNPYFGCIAGRYANRIAKGKFTLDGKEYTLAVNNGNNHLHGGIKGFDKVVWVGSEFSDTAKAGVTMNYFSKDGEEGYPGSLHVVVTYTLDNENGFSTVIEAVTDKATPVNLCNHTYFNLSEADTNILGHVLTLYASRFTEVNEELIPTGNLSPVNGTPMDFTAPHIIGERIADVKGGYDHNYVLDHPAGQLSQAALFSDPRTGRQVEVLTTQPGIQFYTGNFLDGSITGKEGKVYGKNFGFCLETQHFPDSPNRPAFPNTILRPGEKYQETTVWKFGIR